jgi:hypothetical protein
MTHIENIRSDNAQAQYLLCHKLRYGLSECEHCGDPERLSMQYDLARWMEQRDQEKSWSIPISGQL